MVKAALVLAAFLSLLSGCAHADPTLSDRAQQPAPGPITEAGPATAVHFAGNRVPEEPWWQAEADREPELPPPPPPQEIYDISSDVLFAESSAELNASASSQLRHLADELVGDPTAAVEILGHTDSTPGPTADYNDALSLSRANAVRDWLVENGVAIGRITTDGRADREPVASNEDDAGRAANRRVTITVRRTP